MKDSTAISSSRKAQKTAANITGHSSFFKPIQPKPAINHPNDIYKLEADAMVDQVMRMTVNETSRQLFFKPAVSAIHRKCAHCEADEKKLQRKEKNDVETGAGTELENYISSLDQEGHHLSNEVRNYYEPRFSYDFNNVKLHTDTVAAKSAQSVNALAYTSGNNIVFNNGQYSPCTEKGKRLLGDELTHVIQQTKFKPAISTSGLQSKLDDTGFPGSKICNDSAVIQRAAFNESPSFENAERRERENNVMRKMNTPVIQRMERVNSSDPARVTASNVHPWRGNPPVGDDINVTTDGGSTVDAWVAYGGPIPDRYWCHGYTLKTFNESLYSVYSGGPMQRAVNDEYYPVSAGVVQPGDIAVWLPNYDHSCIFHNVVRSGSSLDYNLTIMSTKNGRKPLRNLSLYDVNVEYGTAINQPAFFRHN